MKERCKVETNVILYVLLGLGIFSIGYLYGRLIQFEVNIQKERRMERQIKRMQNDFKIKLTRKSGE